MPDDTPQASSPRSDAAELVDPGGSSAAVESEASDGSANGVTAVAASDSVTSPAKVMRIGAMVRQLLEEVRQTSLDDASRERLAEVYERSVTELSDALSEDLQQELRMLALPFADDDEPPSAAELRIAQAQLVGWLEGLFHGIQATLFAQQLAARQQFEQMRGLPPTTQGSVSGEPSVTPGDTNSGGVYL